MQIRDVVAFLGEIRREVFLPDSLHDQGAQASAKVLEASRRQRIGGHEGNAATLRPAGHRPQRLWNRGGHPHEPGCWGRRTPDQAGQR